MEGELMLPLSYELVNYSYLIYGALGTYSDKISTEVINSSRDVPHGT